MFEDRIDPMIFKSLIDENTIILKPSLQSKWIQLQRNALEKTLRQLKEDENYIKESLDEFDHRIKFLEEANYYRIELD